MKLRIPSKFAMPEKMNMEKRVSLTPPQKIAVLCSQTNSYIGICNKCRKPVEMVSFREAGEITGIEKNELIKQAANGSLHLGIRPEVLLICLDSLLQSEYKSVKNLSN
jgi:hypothetical protein